tara:strand:+ start:750 stop:1361 length:612 start_codon:yes stop_codon:yes gene_type:complete
MVEILCPHCEEEIELDDDARGEFACPFCEGEFEWGLDESDDLDSFMDEIDSTPSSSSMMQGQTQQSIQLSANSSPNTIAVVAIALGCISLLGSLGGAWLPLFGLCNLVIAIPAVVVAYMARSNAEFVQFGKDSGIIKAATITSMISIGLTVLSQIFWLIFIFAFGEVGGEIDGGMFECGSGEYIPAEFVNDGEQDCFDGSDEF